MSLKILLCVSAVVLHFHLVVEGQVSLENETEHKLRSRSCDGVLAACLKNHKCRKVLLRLLNATCKELFSNFNYISSESSKISCSNKCRRKLKRAKRGPLKDLLTCKTDKSDYFPYQDRAERCLAGKIKTEAHDNYEINGCSRIFERCTQNNGCRQRYNEMMHQCKQMLKGNSCPLPCEKALRRFLVSRHSRGFYQCKCDGAFYFQKTCHSMKQNIVNLCASKKFKNFWNKRKKVVNGT